MRSDGKMLDKHNLFYEMKETLGMDGCPICGMTRKAVDSFIEGMLYDKINDHGLRDALVKSKGFCSDHSWQIRRAGNPLAHTLIYAHFLEEMLTVGSYLQKKDDPPKAPSTANAMRPVLKKLKPEAACPLCIYRDDAEERYLRSLVHFIQDQDFALQYKASSGVCRLHFLRIQKLFCPRDIKQIIIDRFYRTAYRLYLELEEIKRKNDYRFASEETGEERDAWVRAISFWTGDAGRK